MKPKITEEQRQQILSVFRSDRRKAIDLALSFGLSRSYPTALAHHRGIKTSAPRLCTFQPRKVCRSDWDDPRWAWAIDRGAILV